MATVYIPALLQVITGGRGTVTVPGSTVREVIDHLEDMYPGVQQRLLEGHALRPGMAAVVDGEVATLGLLQPVAEASEVHFLPAIAGGANDPATV
jgi:molybdopterin synthase sulfur carrier subunit